MRWRSANVNPCKFPRASASDLSCISASRSSASRSSGDIPVAIQVKNAKFLINDGAGWLVGDVDGDGAGWWC